MAEVEVSLSSVLPLFQPALPHSFHHVDDHVEHKLYDLSLVNTHAATLLSSSTSFSSPPKGKGQSPSKRVSWSPQLTFSQQTSSLTSSSSSLSSTSLANEWADEFVTKKETTFQTALSQATQNISPEKQELLLYMVQNLDSVFDPSVHKKWKEKHAFLASLQFLSSFKDLWGKQATFLSQMELYRQQGDIRGWKSLPGKLIWHQYFLHVTQHEFNEQEWKMLNTNASYIIPNLPFMEISSPIHPHNNNNNKNVTWTHASGGLGMCGHYRNILLVPPYTDLKATQDALIHVLEQQTCVTKIIPESNYEISFQFYFKHQLFTQTLSFSSGSRRRTIGGAVDDTPDERFNFIGIDHTYWGYPIQWCQFIRDALSFPYNSISVDDYLTVVPPPSSSPILSDYKSQANDDGNNIQKYTLNELSCLVENPQFITQNILPNPKAFFALLPSFLEDHKKYYVDYELYGRYPNIYDSERHMEYSKHPILIQILRLLHRIRLQSQPKLTVEYVENNPDLKLVLDFIRSVVEHDKCSLFLKNLFHTFWHSLYSSSSSVLPKL